ncbi:polyphosphate--glucose phosphotransferase [Sciscionella marina]|uniref:polyphosphate--glucose phosphotransferase n=1 Tax=Sciscionella marina TaxID=508770 RepID=UPI00037F1CBC|nr:ROK family protein [Sciscionella marina]
MAENHGFGVDIGGSGIKGCVIDLDSGERVGERVRIPTPQPSKPEAVAEVVGEVVREFGWKGPVGVTLPAVIKQGVAYSAANIDKDWMRLDARALFAKQLGLGTESVAVLNDADAAGLAEINHGETRLREGVTVLLTFGTGIGSAVFLNGALVPNTEFGHLEVDGHDAEKHAAASAKEEHDWSWEKWAHHVSKYLRVLEDLVWPDLIIAGGGVSKKAEKWLHLLDIRTEIIPASFKNDAGIVGAADAASFGHKH